MLIVAAARLPLIVQGYWVGLTAQAFAYGVIFLSWTLVTGEGGMLWLCQITFAGVGALTTAAAGQQPRLAGPGRRASPAVWSPWSWGVIVGFLSIRLGDLYVALVTLTFGLLMENLVFTLPSFVNQGLGLTLNRPSFATSDVVLRLPLPGGLRRRRPVHRQLPAIHHRARPQRGPLERGRRQDDRASAWCR